MSAVLVSLAVGCGLLILACLVLGRFLGRRWGAIAGALLVTLAYLVLAVRQWPGADVVTIHVALFATIALTYSLLPQGTRGDRNQGPAWGPVFIVVFFVVIVAVNVVLLLLAEHGLPSSLAKWVLPETGADASITSRFPGTVTPGAHKRELLYDRHLQKLEAQRARGWRIEKGWIGQPVAGRPAVFQVSIEDERGRPLQGATLSGSFLRPSDRDADLSFAMSETREGIYQAEVSLPLAGSWHLLLRVDWGDDRHELRGSTAVLAESAGS